MLTNEGRKQMLIGFLETIDGISDKEYQKRVWIRGEGPKVDDFDETVCDFFDLGDPVLDDYKGFEITENQYLLLKEFRKKFKDFSRENDFPVEFIDTPEWAKIMEEAKKVLKAFNYKNDNPNN